MVVVRGIFELSQLGGTLTSVTDFVKPSRILSSLTVGPAGDGKDRVNLNLEVRHADFSQN